MMKKHILFYLFIFLFISIINSEEYKIKKHLQLGVTDLINVNGIDGSMISLKLDTSDNWATRVGLSMSLMNDLLRENNNSTDSEWIEYGEQYSIGITIIELFYFNFARINTFYYGFGIVSNYSSYLDDNGRIEDEYVYRDNTIKNNRIGVGPIICIGTEWTLSDKIALFIEYSPNALFDWYSRDEKYFNDDQTNSRINKINYFHISIDSNVRLGLSFSI